MTAELSRYAHPNKIHRARRIKDHRDDRATCLQFNWVLYVIHYVRGGYLSVKKYSKIQLKVARHTRKHTHTFSLQFLDVNVHGIPITCASYALEQIDVTLLWASGIQYFGCRKPIIARWHRYASTVKQTSLNYHKLSFKKLDHPLPSSGVEGQIDLTWRIQPGQASRPG